MKDKRKKKNMMSYDNQRLRIKSCDFLIIRILITLCVGLVPFTAVFMICLKETVDSIFWAIFLGMLLSTGLGLLLIFLWILFDYETIIVFPRKNDSVNTNICIERSYQGAHIPIETIDVNKSEISVEVVKDKLAIYSCYLKSTTTNHKHEQETERYLLSHTSHNAAKSLETKIHNFMDKIKNPV